MLHYVFVFTFMFDNTPLSCQSVGFKLMIYFYKKAKWLEKKAGDLSLAGVNVPPL